MFLVRKESVEIGGASFGSKQDRQKRGPLQARKPPGYLLLLLRLRGVGNVQTANQTAIG